MSYNLTTMQSIYHNQDEIVEITYNNSPVYQKSGPTPTYDIRYTTTDNQQLTLSSSTGVVSHTFENNTGYITLDSNKEVPASMFQSCTTLHKIYYSTGVTFESSTGYQHDGCTSLDYVELPSDLVEIPLRCFRECESLCEMTVPSTVTTIGIFAWWKCGLNNHTSGYYQPDIKFTSITPAQNINPDYTFSTDAENGYYTAQAHNTIYKLVPYEAWPDYASDAKWRTSNNYIDWYDTDTTDYESMPFYVENNSNSVETVNLQMNNYTPNGYNNFYVSDDRINWTRLGTINTSPILTITLQPGSRKYLAAHNYREVYDDGTFLGPDRIWGMDTVGGNITSLLWATITNGEVAHDIKQGQITRLFMPASGDKVHNTDLVDARNLVTKYLQNDNRDTNDTFNRAFIYCDALVYAPKEMYTFTTTTRNDGQDFVRTFQECISLTHPPKLPSTVLPYSTYWTAFSGCTSLKAISLPAATPKDTRGEEYQNMFNDCSQLCYIKCLSNPSDFAQSSSWTGFTNGVAASGVFVKKVGTTWPTGANGIPSGWTVLEAEDESTQDYTEPFYVENISNAEETLSIAKSSDSAPTLSIEYLNDTKWEPLCTTSTTEFTKTLQPGEKIYLRCDTNEGWGATGTDGSSNRINGCSKVGGNIMSLIYGSNFTGSETAFKNNTYQAFRSLFDSNTVIEDAKDLLLPATTLVPSCYRAMFGNCTSLTTAPVLPATNLAEYCYRYMFTNTRITVAPALPATTLATGCYYQMFMKTSIIAAPILPATNLTDECYYCMFKECISLRTPPELPATTATSKCYYQMFYGCGLLRTPPELPATTLAAECYTSMFQGCTSLTTTPELPATTLVSKCYSSMFAGCKLINKIKCLATDISASSATKSWISSTVSATGTFTCATGMSQTWPKGTSGIPTGWTVVEV